MRDLTAKQNEASIHDSVSGDTHTLFYRLPTNQERAAYQAALFRRSGNKLENRIFETRISFGEKIVVGFVKGTLGAEGKAFASETSDPDYRSDWKGLIKANAPEILAALAQNAFEGTGVMRNVFDEDEAETMPDPLVSA